MFAITQLQTGHEGWPNIIKTCGVFTTVAADLSQLSYIYKDQFYYFSG